MLIVGSAIATVDGTDSSKAEFTYDCPEVSLNLATPFFYHWLSPADEPGPRQHCLNVPFTRAALVRFVTAMLSRRFRISTFAGAPISSLHILMRECRVGYP